MSVINTNITSMIGQSNLQKSQSSLATSMERLSSGLRINSAKDDAAGQAIANRMTSQVTGLAQAQRNANDGISVAQTTEGALNQVNDNLQRVRELTVQAANGTNSANDLESIQNEIGQRLNEINRISEETSFNGVKVLAENQSLKIQVGSEDGQTISIDLKQINQDTLNLATFDVTKMVDTEQLSAGAAEGAAFSTSEVSAPYTIAADTAGTATSDGKLYQDDAGVFYVSDGTSFFTADTTDPDNVTWDSTTAATPGAGNAEVAVSGLAAGETLHEVQDSNGQGTGEYVIQGADADGNTIYSAATVSVDGAVTKGEALTGDPLKSLDDALKNVDALRSDLGAIQNRFDSAITNLSTNETNLAAARSRIEDADYAVEVGNMTRAQILQQAGTSVLAQANQVPQSVLSLLG
jgi:flagellin